MKLFSPQQPDERFTRNKRNERVTVTQRIEDLQSQMGHKGALKNERQQRRMFVAPAMDLDYELGSEPWSVIFWRALLGLLLLPICSVTTWTLLSRFSHATLELEFWKTTEFWYFFIGCLCMSGWFFTGLARSCFIYVYVYGHEMTHVICVIMCRGKVSDFHVGKDGGYIITDKSNIFISLSPYFVPLWSILAAIIYCSIGVFFDVEPIWQRIFYMIIGFTWSFHMLWTLWMIPRDQPDLKENGTFLSLMIIYLGNVIVLMTLLCFATDSPLGTFIEFGREWLSCASSSLAYTCRLLKAVILHFQTL